MARGLAMDTVLLVAFDREMHATIDRAMQASGLLF